MNDVNKVELRIGGRKSQLAVAQSEIVKELIESKFPQISCDILALSTLGDQKLDKALYTFGGKSLWTKELEVLLLGDAGEFKKIDLIVHSLKDLPTKLPDEFELGCITEREDARDALVMKKGSQYTELSQLPEGSVVGTSSVRRSAQLIKHYPHLAFESVRGSLPTRLDKLDNGVKYDCIILAAAGMHRMGLKDRITKYLDEDEMYYSVGQGSLGIEIRKADRHVLNILAEIEHLPSTYRCLAERSLMRTLEGGCSVPLGVKTEFNESTKELSLEAIVVSPDGKQSVEAKSFKIIKSKQDCEDLGVEVAQKIVEKGGKEILDKIDYERINQKPN